MELTLEFNLNILQNEWERDLNRYLLWVQAHISTDQTLSLTD